MVNLFHDLDLSFYALSAVWLQQLKLLVDFDCDLLVQQLVQTHPHDSVGSLSNSFSDDVLVNILDAAQLRAELVLLPIQVNPWVFRILVLFNVVSQMSIIILALFTLLL
jgi:hypothetical protein